MDASKFLGKVMGLYLIVISIAMFTNMPLFLNNIDKVIHDPQLMFISGFMTLIVGLLMVVSHNIWKWNWQGLITLIAWLTLLKAVSLTLYPQFIDNVSMMFIQNMSIAYTTAVVDFILGLILSYMAFNR